MNNNELYHFGILGMKWGVRRYQPYSTVPRGSGKRGKEIGEAAKANSNRPQAPKTNKQIKKDKKVERKRVQKQAKADNKLAKQLNKSESRDRMRDLQNRKVLSDQELVNKINRLRNEKTLRELTEQEVSPGKTFVKNMMADIAKDTIKDLTKSTVQQIVKGQVRKRLLDDDTVDFKSDLAKALKPKNK